MARGDQLASQWKIIQALISSKLGKSAADLAEDLECHPRTVYRDLEALQAAGSGRRNQFGGLAVVPENTRQEVLELMRF